MVEKSTVLSVVPVSSVMVNVPLLEILTASEKLSVIFTVSFNAYTALVLVLEILLIVGNIPSTKISEEDAKFDPTVNFSIDWPVASVSVPVTITALTVKSALTSPDWTV